MTKKTTHRATIMLIDDERDWLDAMSNALNKEPYRVVTAESGEAALKELQTTLPDLILCDIKMPEMNGYDLFEKIREMPMLKHVPYVFLSNFSDYDTIKTARDLGADDYIAKPFDMEEAKTVILNLLLKYQSK